MGDENTTPTCEQIEFWSGGETCIADLYHPVGAVAGERRPAVVLANGFGALRDGVRPQAQRFAAAGYRALCFDFRYFGDSGGQPRSQILPLEQGEDYRNAITYLVERGDVSDVVVWGTSFSGGIVLQVAAVDNRVQAVISQMPVVDGFSWMRSLRNPVQWTALMEALSADRRQRYLGHASAYVERSVPQTSSEIGGLPGDEQLVKFARIGAQARKVANRDPSTVMTLESIEKILEFVPGRMIDRIAPRPLLIVTTAGYDISHPYEQIAEAFNRACEPKTLMALRMDQLEMYIEPKLTVAADLQIEWLKNHVDPDRPPERNVVEALARG